MKMEGLKMASYDIMQILFIDKINMEYPNFGTEPRNVRLALSTDCLNLHSVKSFSYNVACDDVYLRCDQ